MVHELILKMTIGQVMELMPKLAPELAPELFYELFSFRNHGIRFL